MGWFRNIRCELGIHYPAVVRIRRASGVLAMPFEMLGIQECTNCGSKRQFRDLGIPGIPPQFDPWWPKKS